MNQGIQYSNASLTHTQKKIQKSEIFKYVTERDINHP